MKIPAAAQIEEKKEDFTEKINELFTSCFSSINDSNKGVAYKTMKMWFSNLISNPYDKSKTRINMTNPHYKNYFAGNEAADELFKFLGFSIKAGFVEFESEDLTKINVVLDKITEAISSLPSVQFSPAAPWQVAKPVEKKPEEVKIEEVKLEESKIIESTEKLPE